MCKNKKRYWNEIDKLLICCIDNHRHVNQVNSQIMLPSLMIRGSGLRPKVDMSRPKWTREGRRAFKIAPESLDIGKHEGITVLKDGSTNNEHSKQTIPNLWSNQVEVQT